MTLPEYIEKRDEIGYEESPQVIFHDMPTLQNFVTFCEIDVELKIHLSKVLITRSIPPSKGIYMLSDVEWFIREFFSTYEKDLIEPYRTSAIKSAVDMVQSDDTFGKLIIGTTYLFGVVEYYAKCFLGYNAYQNSANTEKEKFKSMSIGQAFNKLRRSKHPIAISLNAIDNNNIEKYKSRGLYDKYEDCIRLEGRLTQSRNKMLHGWSHNDYSEGTLLVMIYILFHLHWKSLNRINLKQSN